MPAAALRDDDPDRVGDRRDRSDRVVAGPHAGGERDAARIDRDVAPDRFHEPVTGDDECTVELGEGLDVLLEIRVRDHAELAAGGLRTGSG